MIENQIKTQIFLSCGQSDTNERSIATVVKNELNKLGFDVYVATQEQTTKGLKENILTQLDQSEYFIFIDFNREILISDENFHVIQFIWNKIMKTSVIHRGSLFSNQELGVASFLNKPMIAFQEKGLKKNDGIMSFIQGNCFEFSNRENLPSTVIAEVKKRRWDPQWKSQLKIYNLKLNYSDALDVQVNKQARFFHLKVINHHNEKPALNCIAYLEQIHVYNNKSKYELEASELKWKGLLFPNTFIPPRSFRNIDALKIYFDTPNVINFNVLTDYGGFLPQIQGPVECSLLFCVVSENFPIARIRVKVKKGYSLDDIEIKTISSR
jgi:hypothetical protein